jgi:hypothetical protein
MQPTEPFAICHKRICIILGRHYKVPLYHVETSLAQTAPEKRF